MAARPAPARRRSARRRRRPMRRSGPRARGGRCRRSSARRARRRSWRRPRRSSPTCPATPPLPPIVTPLGHESSPSAPAGLVVAHPHAVPSLTSSAPLPGRPVQRHAAGGESASTAAPAWEAEEAPVVSRQAESGVDGGRVALVDGPGRRARAAADPHRVGGGAVGRRDARVASADPDRAVPGPVACGAVAAARRRPRTGARSRPADIALPIQASGRVPTSVSPSPSAAPGAGRAPLAPVRRFAELPVEAPAPPVQREATGRRAGLGAPLPAAPDSAVTERLPMRRPVAGIPVTPASPAASSATVSRLSDGTHATHDPAPAIAAAPAAPARPLPVLPVARQRQDAAPTPAGRRARLARRAARCGEPGSVRDLVSLRPSPGLPRRSCRPSARGRCARP